MAPAWRVGSKGSCWSGGTRLAEGPWLCAVNAVLVSIGSVPVECELVLAAAVVAVAMTWRQFLCVN